MPRIPVQLAPFVRAPNEALLLLTSTLDASASWLLCRFLCDALSPDRDEQQKDAKKVLLVSWLRDYDFWKQEVRKSTGLDLGGLRAQRKFAFVDGLSALFLADEVEKPRGLQQLPARPIPAKGPPGLHTLSSTSLDHASATITAALDALDPSSSTLVILDNPDILLAAVPALAPSDLTSFFLTLHTRPSVSQVLVHLQSDLALRTPSVPPQPLQIAQQNLLVKTAHMSAKVLGIRLLDTGVARDVSGVLRATVHKDSWTNIGTLGQMGDGRRGDAGLLEEKSLEVLYKVQGDGGVRVFERGAATV
ncbi:hypothetical protein BU23DRAFT_559778 [Bimuria novae-zelandiae CBS 107.79]|uniref:Elongator complex protein 6 n=1 Tax=Bimuria novae-zelandiae CBS 107.79 TaxID=1447943 RepID=A0A6A5UNY8_9PLEO|nr:hypothetical protein BU23DRAFT_559778 [Bimuria novae-zelandiae CBS 107.79]